MATKKQLIEQARELFREGTPGVERWSVEGVPWADPGKPAANIRTAAGKLIAEVMDPDDAKLIAEGLRILRKLTEQ